MRTVPRQAPNFYVRREPDARSLRRNLLLLSCGLLLAAGFVAATRQQILAVQYGYETEALRRERESLLEEQRRLRLELEANSSPAQLERAARELGLQPTRATQLRGIAVGDRQATPAFVGAATALRR